MADENYIELVRALQAELRQSGLVDLADLDNYMIEDREGRRLPPWGELFDEMLAAFDRHLSLHDRSTYEEAVTILRKAGVEGPVEDVRVRVDERTAEITGIESQISLSQLPNLSSLRELVRGLRTYRPDRERPDG
jgi:hypothetical protein